MVLFLRNLSPRTRYRQIFFNDDQKLGNDEGEKVQEFLISSFLIDLDQFEDFVVLREFLGKLFFENLWSGNQTYFIWLILCANPEAPKKCFS